MFTKNKVDLADYDYGEDITRRLVLSDLDQLEYEVLEEILFSPIKFPVERLLKNLDLNQAEIDPILTKLGQSNLLTIEEGEITVNKEMRKTYEADLHKFEEIPGIESLRSMLKRVPIHVLPNWYAIPRCADNIFDSIVDKFLSTPQKFQRYMLELNFSDPNISYIIQDVMRSPDYKLPSKNIIDKYDLGKEQFEEIMLYLEYNFVCCLAYERQGDTWHEVVTFFKEWRDYLLFIKKGVPRSIRDLSKIRFTRPSDFAFVEDMGTLLNLASKENMEVNPGFDYYFEDAILDKIAKRCGGFNLASPEDKKRFKNYVHKVVDKLVTLDLAKIEDGKLTPLEDGYEWQGMSHDKRALELHRHPLNRLSCDGIAEELRNEKNIRAAERCITSVVDAGWVFLDEFLQGMIIPLTDEAQISLEQRGRHWKYTLPTYSEDEYAFVSAVIMEWLFETAIVATGKIDGRPCFCVTPFGQTFYD
ncbi:MAG: hypothetical protein KDK44_00305 [Chlamydiia bacterium]|nr:hypothetical protein [Chlamydiia bacterium]HPE84624.1 hypothetical protein [Chlamydiales bacterium]